ncbi:MAG: amidohydrolase family protein [Proteobacteria bacterium]|nr:amidohydrolase family protein [Pseudomonadota bacterium]
MRHTISTTGRRALLAGAMATALIAAPARAGAPAPATAAAVPAGEEIIHDVTSAAQVPGPGPGPASPRGAEAAGPFQRLVITNVMVIDGTGAPPYGPVSIEIAGDRIVRIADIGGTRSMGGGVAAAGPGTRVIDGQGGYVLPGFIDTHEHIGTPIHLYGGQLTDPDYVLKLLLAHGVTTVRDVGSMLGLKWTTDLRQQGAAGTITAPRVVAYALFPERTATPEAAREWVRAARRNGADGVKFLGAAPEVFAAAIDEVNKLGMGSAYHHSQLSVTRQNAVDSAELGLQSIEHWYGLPEAMFEDRTVQTYPTAYNYNDEQDRFGQAGRLWQQAAAPGSPRWKETIARLLKTGVTLDPTFVVYEAARDLSRVQHLEWHDAYTMPYMMKSWAPNPRAHGSFFFDWTSEDEIAWRNNYRLWMRFVNDYKNAGGNVGVGADSGFIYATYGFAYIREFELLQEAGFHPLEVVRAATLNGARLLKLDRDLGTISVGKLADLVVVAENPLRDFKVLYATGHPYLDRASGKMATTTGIRYTIKAGVVFDAGLLRQQVREMVAAKKAK